MNKLPTLYKRSSTGKLQEWTMCYEGDQHWSLSGQVNGKIQENKPTKAKAKNIGRSNETTPEEQAQLEAQAKWQKKKDAGYTEDPNNVDVARAEFFKPMKAQEYIVRRGWDKKANNGLGAYTKTDKVEFPCLMQPKFDGIRMITSSVEDGQKGTSKLTGLSRNGKPLGGAFNVLERLHGLFEDYPELILDGELYNHEFKDDFNELSSLIKKQKPDPSRAEEIRKYVKYYVYDCPRNDLFNENDKYTDRMSRCNQLIKLFGLTDIVVMVGWQSAKVPCH
jgi:DNA ligase-1